MKKYIFRIIFYTTVVLSGFALSIDYDNSNLLAIIVLLCLVGIGSYISYNVLHNKTDKEIAQEQAEDDETDPFLMDAIQTVVETGQASTSFIQRRFKVGYARAGRIIDQMEERGVISGYQGSKPREVLMSLDKWNELKMGKSEENT